LALTFALGYSALPKSFGGFILSLIIVLLYLGWSIWDAAKLARGQEAYLLKPFNRWYGYAVLGLGAVFLSYHVGKCLPIKTYRAPSVAMEPSLRAGDYFVAARDRGSRIPARGSIVIVEWPRFSLVAFRVIGLPGETLEIRNKVVFIEGRPLSSDWGTARDPANYQGRNFFQPITIPRDAVFVLGDNRDNSSDSRFFGPVPIRSIRGRALFVYWAKDKSRIGTRLM
jgi:signal peptidase I